jgi:hypothetical protein
MYEMMFDLETLDTKPSAVVLSVGAVIWETLFNSDTNELSYRLTDRFMRVLNIKEQFVHGRTVSQPTLLWWMRQDRTAQQEAFNPIRRPVEEVLTDLRVFADRYAEPEIGNPGITAFWASPATFDFPIWDDLAMSFGTYVPWSYRQKYDVRTVVREANLSVSDHSDPTLVGIAHTPVFDCERQISLLTAARQRLNRRTGVVYGPRVDD